MLIISKRTIATVLLIILAAGTSYFFTTYKVTRDDAIKQVSSALYDLNAEMNLIEYWNKNHKKDRYFEKQIKFLILNQIYAFFVVKPPLDDLGIDKLEALSRAIAYNDKYGLNYGVHEDVFQNSLLYLKSLESPIREIINHRSKIIQDISNRHLKPNNVEE